MAYERYLIVNADDFGQCSGVNRGIIASHEHGIVTSASLMVRWQAAEEAAAYIRTHPELSIGLHIDLGEWIYRNQTWTPVYEVVPLHDSTAIACEIDRQLKLFQGLIGKTPTHIDSHQHVHRDEPVRSLLDEMARQLGVPLRDCRPSVRYCGDFYGQSGKGEPYPEGIRIDNLLRILTELPVGVTEVSCHPGLDESPDAMYRHERIEEVETLCDPIIRIVLEARDIRLWSFVDFAKHIRGTMNGVDGASIPMRLP